METINHFHCIDFIIDHTEEKLTETFIKRLRYLLKSGTTAAQKDWFAVGNYKKIPNEVGVKDTCALEEVHHSIQQLLKQYNGIKVKTLEDIINFHVQIERIHPSQDGNGRVGRLLLFKECLAANIVPFIITDELKMFYYRGLQEWSHLNGYLTDTCLTTQNQYKEIMQYFRIKEK